MLVMEKLKTLHVPNLLTYGVKQQRYDFAASISTVPRFLR